LREERGFSGGKGAEMKRRQKWWYLLLALPYVGLLWPPVYTRSEPVLFSFPFFYWYQFMWVPVSAVLTGIVYLATRKR
jgi:hypothetical protein